MSEQEKAFWALWEQLEPMMEKFNIKPTLREMFDYGYYASNENIIALIENIRDTWERTPSFNYRNELNGLIEKIKGENNG